MARSRYRSVRYDLEASVAVARVVDNAGGSITPDLLAVALGYSGTNNGTYLTRLANAKLFGVVGGRGARVEITERGRRILAGTEPSASEARRQAFMAVPLFREVFESLPDGPLPERSELAAVLSRDFGEPAEKAPPVAAKFFDSAAQAGVVQKRRDGKYEVRRRSRKFTLVENIDSDTVPGSVVKSRRTYPGGRRTLFHRTRGGDVDENQLWLEEGPHPGAAGARRLSRGRRAGLVAAAVACVAVVAVPLSVALTSTGRPHPTAQPPKQRHTGGKATTLGNGPAEHQVLGALSATTDAGNFDFAYQLSTTAPTAPTPTTTTTTVCHSMTVNQGTVVSPSEIVPSEASAVGSPIASSSASSSSSSSSSGRSNTVVRLRAVAKKQGQAGNRTITECTGAAVANPGSPVNGTGVANTSPKATLIDATVGEGSGNSGLKVSLRVDSTTLYEDLGGLETSLAPPPNMADASGQPISGFASLTEGTIGMREGAIAMIGMASPTGYLDLYQQDIDGATQTGTSTVDGVPVTVYQVAVDPTELVNDPGITSEESTTASAAISVLNAQGYTGTTDQVSIDASGYIREVRSVARFSDGGTVVLDVTVSNFGCAGTVLMPGQQGPSDPPTGCTSPDTGLPPTPTTVPAATQPANNPAPAVQTAEPPPTTIPTDVTTTTTVPPTTSTTTAPTPTSSTTSTTS